MYPAQRGRLAACKAAVVLQKQRNSRARPAHLHLHTRGTMQKLLFSACFAFFVLIYSGNGMSQGLAAAPQIEVVGSDTTATLVVYTTANGKRQELLRTQANVGRNGCSDTKREGDGKTPVGVYEIRCGFGLATPPVVNIAYTQLAGGEKWVDDVASAHYNQWVTKDTAPVDWTSAEDLPKETVAYKYVAVIEYNTETIVKGAGSAIFLHCTEGKPTSGCISVSEEAMVKILGLIQPGTRIVIARSDDELNSLTR